MRRTTRAQHLAAVAISALVKLPSASISRIKLCCDCARVGAIVDDGNRWTTSLLTMGTGVLTEESKGHVESGLFG
ncbi:hypothetical protein CCHR01_18673 [Colletotrichum chrysophilum]|uniref:Secreted protein n=1 Tax=Colletotrichum chrysophilum TaxID=1836956 RepID=A0AAD9A176_9PEZI|nr:hypothetical protein CCHR01_18673 [Colletotrichum chrysophilum]